MDSIGRLLRRLHILFRRGKFARELEEEMAFHRAEAAKQFEADGLAPDGARYAAMRQFDASTLAVVALVLGAAAAAASYLPARRAASVNPVEALRAE